MPFFNRSNKFPAGNAMIAFSWQKYKIGGGETVTFGVTLAPADNVKTPTRIIDNTAFLLWWGQAYLNFELHDGDVGEKVHVTVTVNDTNKVIDGEYTIGATPTIVNYTAQIGSIGNYFRYVVESYDTDKRFVSNKINVTIPITNQPQLFLNYSIMKPRYFFNWEPLRIQGWVTDDDPLVIKYSFDGGRPIIAGDVPKPKEGEKGYFDFSIKQLPDELEEGEHFIQVWAEDKYGLRSSYGDTSNIHKFELLHPVFPRIRNGGFNTKKTKAGTHIIAFGFVEDKGALGRKIGTEFKFDDGAWIRSSLITSVENTKPYAWYWNVPSTLSKGKHTVTFRAIDEDGLPSSNTITRTLEISSEVY